MAAYFLKSGNTFTVSSKEAMDLHEALPVGNYVIKQNPMNKQFYLEQIDQFEIKGKLYGDTTRHADRILNTFKDRDASTGVMLTGEKGSGKTLLTKQISINAASEQIPTIVINSPWCGDAFNSFMQNIDQPCVILFDEFEKVYDKDQQEAILTLLDGVYPSKKLFLLTCNDKWRVDQHMRNRPGRIFYMIDFRGLDVEFVREYCQDNLLNKDHIQAVCNISTVFNQFNFDMLKAMVEDMNRYGETPQEVIKLLNAKPEFSSDAKFNVDLQVGGLDVIQPDLNTTSWDGNPLTSTVEISFKEYEADSSDADATLCSIAATTDDAASVTRRDWNWVYAEFEPQDLIKVDGQNSKFIFMNKMGYRLILTRARDRKFHFDAF
jgi:hypothetical protein